MPEFPYPIAESLPDPVFILGHDTAVLWVNSAAEHWLRRSKEAMVGRNIKSIVVEFEGVEGEVENAISKQIETRGYDLKVRTNGKNCNCEYVVFPCAAAAGLMIKVMPIGRDRNIGDRRNEAVTMLGRMLAHELKNPLAGIYGAAQLLESEIDSPDNRELVQLIKTEVDRISRLAEKIENFGNASTIDYEEFNIHSVLRKAKLLFQSQGHEAVKFVENYDPSLPHVFADRDAVMQIIVNLLANATEAIEQSGQAGRVELRTSYRAGVHRKNSAGTRYALPVNVQIIDNGPGIDESLRMRVFDPFVTGKANGHGLGLALVAKIVEEHGGLIDMQSDIERTVFSLLLPVNNNIQYLR